MTGPWVGIDPGSVGTGVVVRSAGRLIWHRVVKRDHDEDAVRGIGVGPAYLGDVLGAVDSAINHTLAVEADVPSIAVEGIVRPSPHVRRRDGSSLIDVGTVAGAAMVLGAVLTRHPQAVIVPPGGHGKGALSTYPHTLITAAEMRHGLHREAPQNSDLRHARSGWDIAGQGPKYAAIRSARRGATA